MQTPARRWLSTVRCMADVILPSMTIQNTVRALWNFKYIVVPKLHHCRIVRFCCEIDVVWCQKMICHHRISMGCKNYTVYLKMLGLYLYSLIIGHKSWTVLSMLSKIPLQRELQNVVTNNVFWTKSKNTTTTKQKNQT